MKPDRYIVKPNKLDPENSFNVIDTQRENFEGEPFVIEVALTYDQARAAAARLNASFYHRLSRNQTAKRETKLGG